MAIRAAGLLGSVALQPALLAGPHQFRPQGIRCLLPPAAEALHWPPSPLQLTEEVVRLFSEAAPGELVLQDCTMLEPAALESLLKARGGCAGLGPLHRRHPNGAAVLPCAWLLRPLALRMDRGRPRAPCLDRAYSGLQPRVNICGLSPSFLRIQECCTHRLQKLKLQRCGRGLTDTAARSIKHAVDHASRSSDPNGCSLQGLDTLSLMGAYKLTDVGAEALVAAAPRLHYLSLEQASPTAVFLWAL